MFANHTYTKHADNAKMHPGRVEDYPNWYGHTGTPQKPAFILRPSMKLCCCSVPLPFTADIKVVSFPTDDSLTQLRVDYFKINGKPMYFIFALDPHFSESNFDIEMEKLERENGIKKEWFYKVTWPNDYVAGSTGEPINAALPNADAA